MLTLAPTLKNSTSTKGLTVTKPLVVVIGGGPGGYGAAFKAAELGAQAVLIEREKIGGTCLNVGCIPTKTILKTATVIDQSAQAERFGISGSSNLEVNREALRAHKDEVQNEIASQLLAQAKRLKVEIVYGTGKLLEDKKVEVRTSEGTRTFEADAVILATGSRVLKLPFIDYSHLNIWTSDDAVGLKSIPKSIIVIGGGVISVEFASAYKSFGAEVDIVEVSPTIIPVFEKRISRALARCFEERGIRLHLNSSLQAIEEAENGLLRAKLSDGKTLEAEHILVAVGRIPNTEGLGLEDLDIEMNRNAVKVNRYYQSSIDGVFALGDLIGPPMLAHISEAEGEAAAINVMAYLEGKEPTQHVELSHIPSGIYCAPEVSMVGINAEQAKEQGIATVSGIAKYSGNGRALAQDETEGFVSLLAEKESGRLLGAQIIGADAVELVTIVSNAISAGNTLDDLCGAVYAHPTLSEVLKLAARLAQAKVG